MLFLIKSYKISQPNLLLKSHSGKIEVAKTHDNGIPSV